jgi:acyl-CoA synthetase (AMP-forming)/AMP-acid ligase II/carbonic anhydrase/acetyltransferase-like protein (isoleucine patch superfamily)/acyl carrier protein
MPAADLIGIARESIRTSGRIAPDRLPECRTIHDLLTSRAALTPDATAIAAPGRRPLSYRGLLSQVESTVEALRACGVNGTDRVAVVMPNGPEMAVAFAAVAAGAACAPLNPAYRSSEFDFYLSDLNARALMIPEGMASPAREVAQQRNIPVLDVAWSADAEAGSFALPGRTAGRSGGCRFAAADDIALVLHTSGTTARPKIVGLTHANICRSGRNVATTLQLTDTDRCLNVMPLFHIHGLIGALMSTLTAGAEIVCAPPFAAEKFFEWIDTCQPTWYTAVPTIHQAVLGRAEANLEIIRRRPLRFIRSSSASLPERTMGELERVFGTQVIEAYGMTEAAHQMASNPLAPLPRKPGSVGVAAGPDVAIMDDAGNLLPAGRVGEVVIRGANVMNGYENNPAANEKAFTHGWFRTGDQGSFDDDGYLFLRGRLKEIINRGGEKVSPREIDDVLIQHPDVAQAVAFAVPHPTLGEEVAAAVVLKPNASATESALRDFAAGRLADFKVPKQLLILKEIPKGPTGKIQRIGLAEKLAAEFAQQRQTNFVAAATSVETQLTGIWERQLKIDKVGLRDEFHALGGDSLTMATMLIEVEQLFNVEIPVDRFLGSPTIETLVRCIGEKSAPAREHTAASATKPIGDSVLRGLKNRLFQYIALYIPGYRSTRVWLHRMRGVTIGENTSIGLSALIETAYPSLVYIGDNVTIGMRAIIIGHLRDATVDARGSHRHTVRIENNVYVGPGVIVLPNVTIGEGAVVTAGSVVSRSVPPRTLVQGNPAKPIAHCQVSLGGGVSYEDFLRGLTPIGDERA